MGYTYNKYVSQYTCVIAYLRNHATLNTSQKIMKPPRSTTLQNTQEKQHICKKGCVTKAQHVASSVANFGGIFASAKFASTLVASRQHFSMICELSYAHVLGEVGEDTPRCLLISQLICCRHFRRGRTISGQTISVSAGQVCDLVLITIVDVPHQLKPLTM